ncbi:MAG: biopolymer transporter ExbD [Myxococcaceae bacterium]|nr:biopolymer transporter ExbD [Myxococcaceae bacterium]
MGMAAGPKGGIKNEINVTPLVDVVLVLLIIFMVITPMLQRGKEVKLPVAKTSEEKKDAERDSEPLILSITADKKIWVDKSEYDHAGLEKRLREELSQKPNQKLLLKGDQALEVGVVREVMDVARRAGAKGVALAVEQEKEH